MTSAFNHREAGFNLFELIIVMLIIGIFAAIGVPAFKYVTASTRIATEINGLLGDMQYARTEAVREGLSVSVCPSSDGSTCLGTIPSAWQYGWIVFQDPNQNGIVDAAAGEQVLRVRPAFTSTDTFVSSNTSTVAVTFNRVGYATIGAAAGADVTFLLHSVPLNSQWTRCLLVTSAGMVTTEKVPNGNCSS
jgi:type IV fimbrial biogenesis protein FimT